ncbi:MAG: hypothetical protein ACJ74H_13835 [Thermoanaerobaculia bacterium]
MSWDVFIQHLPASALCMADIPDDFEPLPLGRRHEVVSTILSIFPDADATDPTWLTLQTSAYTISFGTGTEDLVTGLTLHVRGDESAIPPIVELIDRLGARAIDSFTGEFFDPATARESMRRLRAYVDEL